MEIEIERESTCSFCQNIQIDQVLDRDEDYLKHLYHQSWRSTRLGTFLLTKYGGVPYHEFIMEFNSLSKMFKLMSLLEDYRIQYNCLQIGNNSRQLFCQIRYDILNAIQWPCSEIREAAIALMDICKWEKLLEEFVVRLGKIDPLYFVHQKKHGT